MAINQAQLLHLLAEYRRENWKGIQTPERQQKIIRGFADESEPRILARIASAWSLPPVPKILDLGSGVGSFVVACRKSGLQAFGVEPDRIGQGASLTSLQIAGKRLDSLPFAAATGEQLPFRDATFDLVVLDQVLEHVQDQRSVVSEAFRVVKPSGAIYIACPNYLRFYESHYGLGFFPLMPKRLAAWYLRRRGRDPVLIWQLTYTTNWRVRKLLKPLKSRFIDLNERGLLRKCRGLEGNQASPRARAVRHLMKIPGVSKVVLAIASLYMRLCEGGCEVVVFKEA